MSMFLFHSGIASSRRFRNKGDTTVTWSCEMLSCFSALGNSYDNSALGPYSERIYLWFEPFFIKEIRCVIEWLRDIKTADQHSYKFLQIQQNKFFDTMWINCRIFSEAISDCQKLGPLCSKWCDNFSRISGLALSADFCTRNSWIFL